MIRERGKRGTYSGVEISGGKCSKSNEAEEAGEHLGENMARGREEKKKNTIQRSNSFAHQNALNVIYTQCNVHSINQHVFKYIQRNCSQKFFFFLTKFWI